MIMLKNTEQLSRTSHKNSRKTNKRREGGTFLVTDSFGHKITYDTSNSYILKI